MCRSVLTALLGAGLIVTTTWAQDPKPKEAAKAKQPQKRIAINDPENVKNDPEFQVQGEYVATMSGEKVGLNLVAQGNKQFKVKMFKGSLPGEGSSGQAESGTATLDNEKLAIKLPGKDLEGTLKDGTLEISQGSFKAQFTKVVRQSKTLGEKPPTGAVVLFGEPSDVKNWNNGKLVKLSDGEFLGVGTKSKETFKSFKAHIEFRLPWMPNSRGQGRANSGVYLQDRYEIQVLDSFGLNGENNECGGIYQQFKPLVNMCYPPLQWQTYDIEFTAAKFDAQGKRTAPAVLTLYHNGVLIHDTIELKGSTGGGGLEADTPGPFQLQNHGDPVVYRNIWVVPTK